MASLQEEFGRWRAARAAGAAAVELLRVEEEGGLVLGFSRPGAGRRLATVCLAPVEGASFFAEGLEDPPDEVEDWLTEVNSQLAESARPALAEALDALLAKAPKSLGLAVAAAALVAPAAAADDGRGGGDGEAEGSGHSDEGMPSEEEEDDQATLLADIQAGEDRSAQRAAYSEELRWDSMVGASSSQGSRQASQVLMREMRNLMGLAGEGSVKALEIDMVNDSLYRWAVKMHAAGFPRECLLQSDLAKFGREHPSRVAAVVMDVHFPDSYPMAPPFIRVVRPRFQVHTGHITIGGSICMQLLTPSGWLPSVSLENVFVSIRSEMIEGGGRIDFSGCQNDYTADEAKEAFNRVAGRYGWLGK